MRKWTTIFGICLTILWIGGLTSENAADWLAWLDGVAAIGAFGMVARQEPLIHPELTLAGYVALSAALFVVWLVGVATNGTDWQNWWTFAFSGGFAALAAYEARRPASSALRSNDSHTSLDDERDHFDRSA